MSILIRIRHRQEAERTAKLIAQLARETDHSLPLLSSSDERHKRLRGIPVVGQNVPGAIGGTRP